MKKVFVGTLYSSEGDIDYCADAIRSQKGVIVNHIVISNFSEKPAHNVLWSLWNSAKTSGEYAAFVKIDADTILKHDRVLNEVVDLLYSNSNITAIQAPLYDYFTDDLINGMNCFKPEVVFKKSRDKLYCDRVDSGHKIVLRNNDLPKSLIPAADHCIHATHEQAFHYGLHRSLKNQTVVMQKVRNTFSVTQDIIRGFALIGSMMAPQFAMKQTFNYTDNDFKVALNDAIINYDSYIRKL